MSPGFMWASSSGNGIGESVMCIIIGTPPAISAVLRASLTGSGLYSQTSPGP
jgi:hypothetical protein